MGVELAALGQLKKNLLLENYSKCFGHLMPSGERLLPFGLLVCLLSDEFFSKLTF